MLMMMLVSRYKKIECYDLKRVYRGPFLVYLSLYLPIFQYTPTIKYNNRHLFNKKGAFAEEKNTKTKQTHLNCKFVAYIFSFLNNSVFFLLFVFLCVAV